MKTEEFKKKLYDTVEPLLDGQGVVKFVASPVLKYANAFNIGWTDEYNNAMITAGIVSELTDDKFGYFIDVTYHCDHYDYAFSDLARENASFANELGHFYESWEQVEKVLKSFTIYLVRELN